MIVIKFVLNCLPMSQTTCTGCMVELDSLITEESCGNLDRSDQFTGAVGESAHNGRGSSPGYKNYCDTASACQPI